MNDARLLLWSEAGNPTFIPHRARSGSTPFDLQWMIPSCYDWATVCKTDSGFKHSHFSDHLSIATKLDLPSRPLSTLQPRTRLTWAKTNWEGYKTNLSSGLLPILEVLRDHPVGFDVNVKADAITSSTPSLTISHHTRRWWCAKTLNPLKGHTNNLRRTAQRTNSPADRVLYHAARYAYQRSCKEAKVSHWLSFLAQLTASDLFTAARYTSGPPGARALPLPPPLRKPDGQLISDPAEKTDLLFQATGGPMIPCDLSSFTPPAPRGTPLPLQQKTYWSPPIS